VCHYTREMSMSYSDSKKQDFRSFKKLTTGNSLGLLSKLLSKVSIASCTFYIKCVVTEIVWFSFTLYN